MGPSHTTIALPAASTATSGLDASTLPLPANAPSPTTMGGRAQLACVAGPVRVAVELGEVRHQTAGVDAVDPAVAVAVEYERRVAHRRPVEHEAADQPGDAHRAALALDAGGGPEVVARRAIVPHDDLVTRLRQNDLEGVQDGGPIAIGNVS